MKYYSNRYIEYINQIDDIEIIKMIRMQEDDMMKIIKDRKIYYSHMLEYDYSYDDNIANDIIIDRISENSYIFDII